jgi:hypothetical protein
MTSITQAHDIATQIGVTNSNDYRSAVREIRKKLKNATKPPKKAREARQFFSVANRQAIKGSLPPGTKGTEVTRELNAKWKEVPETDRRPYIQKAKEDKTRHDRELAAYNGAPAAVCDGAAGVGVSGGCLDGVLGDLAAVPAAVPLPLPAHAPALVPALVSPVVANGQISARSSSSSSSCASAAGACSEYTGVGAAQQDAEALATPPKKKAKVAGAPIKAGGSEASKKRGGSSSSSSRKPCKKKKANTYTVERIVGWRIHSADGLQFMVKWEGYGDDSNTWESNQPALLIKRRCVVYFEGEPYDAECTAYDEQSKKHTFEYDGDDADEVINLSTQDPTFKLDICGNIT